MWVKEEGCEGVRGGRGREGGRRGCGEVGVLDVAGEGAASLSVAAGRVDGVVEALVAPRAVAVPATLLDPVGNVAVGVSHAQPVRAGDRLAVHTVARRRVRPERLPTRLSLPLPRPTHPVRHHESHAPAIDLDLAVAPFLAHLAGALRVRRLLLLRDAQAARVEQELGGDDRREGRELVLTRERLPVCHKGRTRREGARRGRGRRGGRRGRAPGGGHVCQWASCAAPERPCATARVTCWCAARHTVVDLRLHRGEHRGLDDSGRLLVQLRRHG